MKLKKKITIIAIATVMAAGSIGAIGASDELITPRLDASMTFYK